MAKEYLDKLKSRFLESIDTIAKTNKDGLQLGDIITSLGMLRPNFSKLKRSETNYPTLEHCEILCRIYGVSPAWLMLNEGPMKSQGGRYDPLEALKAAVTALEEEKAKKKPAKKLTSIK